MRTQHGLITMSAVTVCLLISSLSACTTNPFEPTTDTVSSTSGKTWWNEDGLLKSEYKTIAFATYNKANLEQDMAQGRGEYLASMGMLLGVTAEGQAAFQSAAQDRFTQLAPANQSTRLEQLRALAR